MGILDNILNLFSIPNENKNIPYKQMQETVIKLPKLDKIGVDTPNCPYCNAKLQKFPTRKTKCKNCGKYMYVRTRPIDNKKVLLKEQDIGLLEEEWEKCRYINEKAKIRQFPKSQITGSLVIDTSEEMNVIIKDLIKHYKDYCNYNEMLHINEKDRLLILQYIWDKWAMHRSSIEKDLKYTYPQYNFKDIRLITYKEHQRINTIYKQQKAIEMFESGDKDCLFLQPFVCFSCSEERNQWRTELGDNPSYKDLHKNFSRHLCSIYDMHKIFDTWYRANGIIERYFFGIFNDKIKPQDLKYYRFWVNGEIKQLNDQEFLNWCKSYNIDYPLYDEEKPLLS